MAVAYELACAERGDTVPRLARMRDRLRDAVLSIPGVELTGHPRRRLPGLLSVIARDTDGDAVVNALDLEGVSVSTGSACTTGSTEPSHVLAALGYPEEEARGALRLSVGRTNTDEEIDRAAVLIRQVLPRMRTASVVVAADPLGEQVEA
jgi:cysteine desulfurase